MHIAEFTLHAKPGHFQDVADIYCAMIRVWPRFRSNAICSALAT